MALQTNPKITCSFCKKLLTQRHLFHHLHTSHHSDLWTPSNKKVLEKAIAKEGLSDIILEVKGYDSLFYLSPFSHRMYTKLGSALNDYKKHNRDRVKFKDSLTSLLSSSPAEKKTVTQVSEVTPAQKDELLALKKLLAIMAKELMLERRETAEKQQVIDVYKAKLVENGMSEEEVDDLEPLCDAEPDVFDYKKDMLTKKHALMVTSFDLSDLGEIEKAKYSSAGPAALPSFDKPLPPPSVEPSLPPPVEQPPVEQPPSQPSQPELPVLARPLVKKPPKKATSAAEIAQAPAPIPAPPPPAPKPQRPPYQQFVYREPVPQYPKILQTSKRAV